MSTLKDILFPDSNITGYTDKYNQPIMVGNILSDKDGYCGVVSIKEGNRYAFNYTDSLSTTWIPLNLFIIQNEGMVEVISTTDKLKDDNKNVNTRNISTKPIKKTKRNY